MITRLKVLQSVIAALSCVFLLVPALNATSTKANNTVLVDGKEVEILSVPQNSQAAVDVSLDNLLDAKTSDQTSQAVSPENAPAVDAAKGIELAKIQEPAHPQELPGSGASQVLTDSGNAAVPELPASPAENTIQQASATKEIELKARVDDLLKGVDSSIEKNIETVPEDAQPIKPAPPVVTEKSLEKQAPPISIQDSPARPTPEIITEEPPKNQMAQTDRPANIPRYPWRRNIQTSVFWVGEPPSANVPKSSCNTMSAWDMNWVRNFGGFDDPNRRNGFFPARFRPKQNPFYVALPFNDMRGGRHKPISRKVIPWFHEEYIAPNVSVCKSRWIAVRYRGRIVYGQWEDVGPFEHDHPEYVFGKARPRPNQNKNAGLDISPAMRDYLGMNGLAPADWKFVDDHEVPPGPWKKIVNIRASLMAKLERQQRNSSRQ